MLTGTDLQVLVIFGHFRGEKGCDIIIMNTIIVSLYFLFVIYAAWKTKKSKYFLSDLKHENLLWVFA